MDPSEINNFEDQWRKAFQGASETPPPSVWEGIEARLDEEKGSGVVLPLWWQSPRLWYAAASVAALLFVGLGLWYANDNKQIESAGQNQVAVQKPIEKQHDPANTEIARSEAEKPSSNEKSAEKSPLETSKQATDQATIAARATAGQPSTRQNVPATENEVAAALTEKNKNADVQPSRSSVTSGESFASNTRPSVTGSNKGEVVKESQAPVSTSQSVPENLAIAADGPATEITTTTQLLASLPYRDLDVHVQKRYVFFRPETRIEEPVAPPKHKEYWAALGLMPASFNPDLKVKEAPTAFSAQSVSNKKSVSGTSESGVSYALQTQGGMRLSKHWSVELGVSYLKGNSDYQGGGYVLNAYNSVAANVLENALAGLSSRNESASFDKLGSFNNGALYIDVAKKVSNNYHYLQLPVQAGFTINPDKRLSYSLLGGMMANFFLSNELEAASGEIIKTTASDDIYRGMNWAATTGLRFNYKLSSKWNANLTGSYQKAVSSGFKSNQSLESHPYLYGVSWGVRYSF